MVKKLEQGQRQTARLTSLTAFASALDVSIGELSGKRPRLDSSGSRLVLGIRDTLFTPNLLVGVDDDDDGQPTDAAVLWRAVQKGWQHYWAGRFTPLAQALPGMIGEARLAHRIAGTVGPLVQAYQLAANLLVHLGREDLAAVAAERGVVAARTGDDELQWVTCYGSYCWALMGQGRHVEAEKIAAKIAARIEPQFSTAGLPQITVWGGMVLWAMAAAVEAGHADTAVGHLDLAKVGAARLAEDRHDYETNFGPTQVAMQATYTYSVLGEPGQALAAAQRVRRRDLRTISYGRHLIDVAQANADARRTDRAVRTLFEAKELAPVWFRHQPAARTLVADLAERQSRLSPTLRDLVSSLDAR